MRESGELGVCGEAFDAGDPAVELRGQHHPISGSASSGGATVLTSAAIFS